MSEKILLVDDDASLRKLYGFILKREGFQIQEAADGVEALSKLREDGSFDLLIVDVMMPMLDGIRLLSIVRNELKLDVPVLVLTSVDRAASGPEIEAAGANEVAIKPIPHSELVDKVKYLLSISSGHTTETPLA